MRFTLVGGKASGAASTGRHYKGSRNLQASTHEIPRTFKSFSSNKDVALI